MWPWIAALLTGLPVLYVASFGLTCWLVSRVDFLPSTVLGIYRPVEVAISHSRAAETAFLWYAELASPATSWWHLDRHERLTLGYYPPPPPFMRSSARR